MGRKKKYENALIVKDILAREFNALGDLQGSIAIRYIDLKNREDRKFLKVQIEGVAKILNDAIKELEKEDKKNESNDMSADESEEVKMKS